MRLITVLFFLTTLLSTSSSSHARLKFNPIQLPHSAASGDVSSCLSWRLTVETHNRQGKINNLVPQSCVCYVKEYMLDGQYNADCKAMADVAIDYANSVEPAGDGKDVWVFDIDETTLSNLGYYKQDDVQFGSVKPADNKKFYEWVEKGEATAVPDILRLYKKTQSLGFKNVILTGLRNDYALIREKNLKKEGYDNWEKLIFKDVVATTDKFKSDQRTKLVKEGYRIVGNVGDQWGDITGANAGDRTFKVPNPMYYS